MSTASLNVFEYCKVCSRCGISSRHETFDMKTLVQGKEAVLRFLEDETLRRTNEKPGIYALLRDEAEQLILTIEGFTFIGSGTVTLGGNTLQVLDGSIMAAKMPS
jgi:hypothetical protein